MCTFAAAVHFVFSLAHTIETYQIVARQRWQRNNSKQMRVCENDDNGIGIRSFVGLVLPLLMALCVENDLTYNHCYTIGLTYLSRAVHSPKH